MPFYYTFTDLPGYGTLFFDLSCYSGYISCMEPYSIQNTSYLEQLLRLRYEILGETFEALAASQGLVASVIRQLATREGWKQRFPLIKSPSEKNSDGYEELVRARLAIFDAARDLLLAGHIAYAEGRILERVTEILEEDEGNNLRGMTMALGLLKSIQGTLTKKEAQDAGLPLFVLKDMSGTKK
jgi:hypothetical protein